MHSRNGPDLILESDMLFYLNHLPEWLELKGQAAWADWLSPLRVFQYVTFRSAGAAVTALLLCLFFGPRIMDRLKRLRVCQEYEDRARKLGGIQEDGNTKRGTATMGGLLILGAIDVSALFWAQWNSFVLITLMSMLGLGLLGFCDDYVKISRQDSRGIASRVKWLAQLALAGFIVFYLCSLQETRSLVTEVMVPFLKEPILTDFPTLAAGIGGVITVMAIVGSSNAVNLADGLDGLAIGSTAIVAAVLYIFAYIAGHAQLATHLLVPYTAGSSELAVICAAMIGASLGFLWFNCFPAQVFMGDTGALALGGALGVIVVLIHQPLILFIAGGVFVLETASVILQLGWFKLTRWQTGTGSRIFLAAPLHDHFLKKGWHENRVVVRSYILSVLFAVLALSTLKLR